MYLVRCQDLSTGPCCKLASATVYYANVPHCYWVPAEDYAVYAQTGSPILYRHYEGGVLVGTAPPQQQDQQGD